MSPPPVDTIPIEEVDRIDVLGVGIHALEPARLVPTVGRLIERGGRATIAYANAHVLNLCARDAELRAFLNRCTLVYADGNGVVHAARLLGHHLPGRMTGADWIQDLARAANGRWRLAWIGGAPGTTEAAAEALRAQHPGLRVHCDHGYHPRSGPEDAACIDRINAFAPHILLVGMGSPEQERWVAARRDRLQVPVVWCLGATAEVVSGRVPRPGPAWLVEHHEWLSRLLTDPRRLWRRYLVGNGLFLARTLRARVRG